MPRALRVFLAILAVSITASVAQAAKNTGLIELRVGTDRHEGRVLSRDSRNVILLDRAGRITELPLKKVTSFRTVSPRFAPLTSTMLNSKLLKELGRGYEVKTTRHYVVAASPGRAQKYVELFEEIYRAFHMHFSVGGFEIDRPEFLMVAIVFPDHAAFSKYARSDKVNARPGLMGYYMPTTNRVALFEGSSTANRPQGNWQTPQEGPLRKWSQAQNAGTDSGIARRTGGLAAPGTVQSDSGGPAGHDDSRGNSSGRVQRRSSQPHAGESAMGGRRAGDGF
jgi:hypothetical protein